ncbi:MAG: indolepyruvate oxidoreductase subunit beta [Deltaproteobacteria bacterium]|nr:indolepyruvate oxidoreductase subunit beta [Deltaproteobacteria bacterium]
MEKGGNILFCGVGGQGILLASDITSAALLGAGFDVKKSEVHGMAQRGGAVVAHLRYGAKVYSPLIELGTAHMVVAFELLESLRYLPYLNPETKVIVNTQKILPPSVTTGVETYPEDVLERLGRAVPAVFPVDALAVAESLGEIRAVNMVLVGSLSSFLPVPENVFCDLIEKKVPKKFIAANTEAFRRGREIVKQK